MEIKPAEGKLGIMLPGLGAVSTTFIAGVLRIRKGLSKPYGSVSQMQTIRLGRRDEGKTPLIKDFVPLADLKDIEFAAWDIFEDNAYEAAKKAGVLSAGDLEEVRDEMESIRPMKAVFDQNYVKNLEGTHVKQGTKFERAQQLREDIRTEMEKTFGEGSIKAVYFVSFVLQ